MKERRFPLSRRTRNRLAEGSSSSEKEGKEMSSAAMSTTLFSGIKWRCRQPEDCEGYGFLENELELWCEGSRPPPDVRLP